MLDRIAPAGKPAVRAPRVLYRNLRRDGLRRTKDRVAFEFASRASRGFVEHVRNPGTPIWDREWDVLLVLDACRRDLLCEVADEFDVVGGPDAVGAHWSVGSKSAEWIRRTFAEEYSELIERTAYVTGNPFTATVEFETEPAVLDEVWLDAWNDELGTVLPRPLTDRAIATWRESDVDRMIVHYMQPHIPFVTGSDPDSDLDGDPTDFREGTDGFWRPGMGLDEVWPEYRDNLRYVLEDVSHFCASVDADTVAISADHGNATGTLGVWGHPSDLLLPSLRRVPWVETTARDTGDYTPDVDRTSADASDEVPADGSDEAPEVRERLRSLGYVE